MTNDETIDALIAACVEQASVMLSCKHDVRTPSRSAGSYEHHNAPVEFCHECGVACFWGAPLPAERAMVSVPATALVAMRDEVIALRKVLADALPTVSKLAAAEREWQEWCSNEIGSNVDYTLSGEGDALVARIDELLGINPAERKADAQ